MHSPSLSINNHMDGGTKCSSLRFVYLETIEKNYFTARMQTTPVVHEEEIRALANFDVYNNHLFSLRVQA